MIPPSIAAILTQAQADAAQVEQAIRLILARRPDLQAEELREHLLQLATTTAHNVLAWAESCLERARHGEPMPWEVAP